MTKLEVLAVVPARGNSKSIPRKNIRPLGGVPLIAYSIAAGLQSQAVTRTIVSTDDEEIAAGSRVSTAPRRLSCVRRNSRATRTLDFPVFKHAPGMAGRNTRITTRMCSFSYARPRPSARLNYWIRPCGCCATIRRRIRCVGWCRPARTRYKMWSVNPDGSMSPILKVAGIKEAFNTPRQQLPDTYWQTGHVDAIRPRAIWRKIP